MLFTCSQLCDEIDEHEKNSPDTIEEEKKKIPGIWMKTKWIEGINKLFKNLSSLPCYYPFQKKKTLQLPCRASKKKIDNNDTNQRSLRDSTIFQGVCVGEMLVLKAICDALKPIA